MQNRYSYFFFTLVSLFLFYGCKNSQPLKSIRVDNNNELQAALSEAQPGDHIIMANGIWEDVQIKIKRSGISGNPISLSAETSSKVLIQGNSNLELGGNHIIVDGLYFINGASPSRAVIQYAVNDTVANHCVVTNCVINDYNKKQRNIQDLWVLFKGRHNQLDHCYLSGKSNKGPTIRVDLAGNENINNHHKIINNHFGPRPPKGGPSAETIQLGNSYTSMCPSYTLVANNLFDECNGEVEVISSKTNFNEFRNNVFYKSEGSLVTRHGNYCTIDGNYFIGDEANPHIGGVRLIGTGHTVTNNYFYNLKGKEFRSPIAVMNGIRKSPLNRYIQVTDVTVAHNSFINCIAPLQFGVGSNVSQKDVLPASEIRSERPIRTVVSNNLIYNSVGDEHPIIAHDKLDGILFESNVINNQEVKYDENSGMISKSFEISEISDFIMIPTASFPKDSVYKGFGFEAFNKDLFGTSREDHNMVGAINGAPSTVPQILEKSLYGPDWYNPNGEKTQSKTHEISTVEGLVRAISQANHGDVISLKQGEYAITTPIKIDKKINIITAKEKADLRYSGSASTPLFEMNPGGELTLNNLHLIGTGSQFAFSSLKENMSSLSNLNLENCTVENFNYILKAYKYSFSEFINLKSSTFRNCQNGIGLAAEHDDKGDYNAENVLIDNCIFEEIQSNVINYYRGGYDESTVGGNLSISNSTFSNCGAKEKNGILLNTYGIINVDLTDNTFENNRIQNVALLWGAKNNHHSNNVIINSGIIRMEENLKLKTFY